MFTVLVAASATGAAASDFGYCRSVLVVVVVSFFLPRIPRLVSVVVFSSTTGGGGVITTRSEGGGVITTRGSGGGGVITTVDSGAGGTITTRSGGCGCGTTTVLRSVVVVVISAVAACRGEPSMPLAAITTELKRTFMFMMNLLSRVSLGDGQ
jgi:hypothetical protein